MGKSYTARTLVTTYKWAKSHPTGIIPIDWCTKLTGEKWLQWFRQCLDIKISATLPRVGRKWEAQWQIEAQRTARSVNSRFVVRWVPVEFRDRLQYRLFVE